MSIEGKYLTFAVSQERYGVDIQKVQEIIQVPSITRVPKTLKHIKGVINLRGKIIPVVDLRTRFGIQEETYDEKTCIIVVSLQKEEQRISVGVIVDTVLEVLHFSEGEVGAVPHYGSHLDVDYIVGMAKKDEQLNILLNVDRVIGE